MNKEKKITKESVLKDILEIKGAEEILQKHELPCLHCPMAQYELHLLKLGEVCQRYSIDLDKVLEELNKLIEN
jgi:hypothetical protein